MNSSRKTLTLVPHTNSPNHYNKTKENKMFNVYPGEQLELEFLKQNVI